MQKRLPPAPCPQCGAVHDAASTVDRSEATPAEGDLTICVSCGAVSKFTVDFQLKAVEEEELQTYEMDVQLQVRRASRLIKRLLMESRLNALQEAIIGTEEED